MSRVAALSARLSRRTSVLVLLALAAAMFATSAATWVSAAATPAVGGTVQVHVSGTAAAPAVAAAAILVAAAALAAALAGTWTRRLVGVGVVAAGVVAGTGITGVLRSPEGQALSAAASRIGVPQIDDRHVTIAPWIALMVAILVVLAGVGLVVFRPPDVRTARFDPVAVPSAGSNQADAAQGRAGRAPATPASAATMWDALNRGDDPTESAGPAR